MRLRCGGLLVACAAIALRAGVAFGGERWVDDDGALSARQIQLKTGVGVGLLSAELREEGSSNRTYHSAGTGLNVEAAVGLGAGVELGARVAHRLVSSGRGMRGDEIARLEDTETYGTGLDDMPNPELRARWRAYRWVWGEAGVENRLVAPLESERIAAEVIGAWTSLHLRQRARLDLGANAAFTWRWFAGGRVVESGVGVPIRLWANLTQGSFVGLVAAPHYFGGTDFTSARTYLLMGLGAGYRVRRCDLLAMLSSRNVLDGVWTRVGLGMGVACRT